MNIAEKLSSILPGVEITEDFTNRLQALIEFAVIERVNEATNSLETKLDESRREIEFIKEKANEYGEHVFTEVAKRVDDYCDYVVGEFLKSNVSRLVETEEYNRMAFALRRVKEAFQENYFSLIPEPANDKMRRELDESKKSYNELFEEHRDLKRKISDYSKYIDSCNRKSIFEELTKDLAETQIEKIKEIVEKANFQTTDTLKAGIQMIIEEFKPGDTRKTVDPTPPTLSTFNDKMKSYLDRL